MAATAKKRARVVSIRLTDEELEELRRRAEREGRTLGSLLRLLLTRLQTTTK